MQQSVAFDENKRIGKARCASRGCSPEKRDSSAKTMQRLNLGFGFLQQAQSPVHCLHVPIYVVRVQISHSVSAVIRNHQNGSDVRADQLGTAVWGPDGFAQQQTKEDLPDALCQAHACSQLA